jgi:hypothetical protein
MKLAVRILPGRARGEPVRPAAHPDPRKGTPANANTPDPDRGLGVSSMPRHHTRACTRFRTYDGCVIRPRREPTVPGANDVPGRLRPTLPDSPAAADHDDALERLASADPGHSERWSRAELRERLERLPACHPSAVRSDAPERAQQRPDHRAETAERNYWSEVPRFERAWADHVRRWPGEQLTQADPVHLSPEQHKQVEEVIAGVRRTEEDLTKRIAETGRDNAGRAWLEGLEFRLKGEDRLKEKIANLLETGAPDATTKEIARQIPDAIRYTFCATPDSYSEVYWTVKGQLEACGYSMYYGQNHWGEAQYKGINTRWVTPEGQRFELQFHTPESFHAKQAITHVSYERLRSALTADSERRELMSFQREVSSWIAAPAGAAEIPNYREEGL